MADITVDVTAASGLWRALDFDPEPLARDIIALAFAKAQKPATLGDRLVEVSLMLTDDETIQVLNREWRGKDKPTNVLSFAALEGEENAPASSPCDMPCGLGDIVIAYETVQREAATMDIPFRDHYIHLLIHGTLHLLGYDHETEREAKTMETLEISLLSQLGIENPYSLPDFMA